MTDTKKHYQSRMQKVLDYIDLHLDDCLDLDTLSGVAAFSKYHFHRQFIATFSLPLNRYVQLARLKRASYKLAFREHETITQIAMDAGYAAPDAFARVFRQRVGQPPSHFRKSPDWQRWNTLFTPLHTARNRLMPTPYQPSDVRIRTVPATPVAIMEHRGDPSTIGTTLQRFIAWRRSVGLIPSISPTFNVFHTDPRTTPPQDYRLDLCAGTGRPVVPNGETIKAGSIPAGRCAVLRVEGGADNLEPAALYLYRDWLPASGEEPGDFPLYCQRITFFPDVAENQAITELFLPLRCSSSG
ncbi:AraC family transcriptional regulator [Pseudomonas sp. NFACC15-1]|uniref:AraC family transcriptional regulator n=1 Tax=unclassified Pseudomonas TaxID=196821 RepID=UPI00088AF5C4|nr:MULTISPECIES: AraC family transcriptional regulator [unclassified Pseudomonas]SDA46254.1 AraC family transcriptional regulator [Pseudomonas sp. NFACC15-1]SDX18285.1 AraC family transcriptional regulator [Pseudomonas sp. NFACC14]